MNSFKGKSVHFDERYLHVELEDGRRGFHAVAAADASDFVNGDRELGHRNLRALNPDGRRIESAVGWSQDFV